MKKILLAMLVLTLGVQVVTAVEWTHREHLAAEDLSWSTRDGKTELAFSGSVCLEATDALALPGRVIRLPLPWGERLADFSFSLSAKVPIGARLPARMPDYIREDGHREADPGVPPGEVVLLGQPAERGRREVVLYWRPLSESGGELFLRGELELNLITEADTELPLRVLREDRGTGESTFRASERPSLGDSPVDAVIITTEAMSAAFQDLADWHLERGTRCVVRSTEWIAQNYPVGADLAETLRFFLQDAYQYWGLQSVLLGGDTSEIPVRYFTYQRYSGGQLITEPVPNDLYYSCLDGNWNADGDQYWGEAAYAGMPGDNADIQPELMLGRIPVSNLVDAQGVVDKIIAYRESPPSVFQNKALFLAEVLFPADWPADEDSTVWGDGARYAATIIDDYLSDEMEASCLFQNYVDPLWAAYSPTEETVASSMAAMESGNYAFVDHNGHGYRYNMSVGDGNILTSHARALTNSNPFHITLMNCTSTAFDFDCLGEAYLRNPNGGAASVFGTTRKSYPSHTVPYYNRFYEILFEGETRTGRIFDQIRQEHYSTSMSEGLSRWTYFIVTYLGDPLLDLWAGDPILYTVTAPTEVFRGPSQVDVHVDGSEGGGPLENVRVTLSKGDEVWVTGLTDASGDLSLDIQPATEGEIKLTAWGRNGVMHHSNIAVLGGTGTYASITAWATDDDTSFDPLNDGDAVAESGERLRLLLDVSNTGDSSLIGAELDIVSLHDSLAVTVGHEDLETIPAADMRQSQNLEILLEPGLADGERADLLVTLSAPGQDNRIDTLHIVAAAPIPVIASWILDDALPAGDGDGTIEAGESFRANVRLVNLGAGGTGDLDLTLHSIVAGVNLEDSLDVVTELELLESGESAPGFLLALDDPGVENLAWLEIVDLHGRSWKDTLDFLPPAPPTAPEALVSDSASRIELIWGANGEDDLQGYHVYVAEGDPAPFVRVTQVPISHASMSVDGLPESSAIQCYVTAVDWGGLESAAGGILYTSTNPAQNPGFPQEMQDNCTSSLAVGNIAWVEGLEIVTAADYVYAFNFTGQEVRDGDGSSQTPGIFSLEAVDMVGGVTLLPLDDGPLSQIVVGSRGGNPAGSAGIIGIHVLDGNGGNLPGWPKPTVNWVWANIAGADIDGDGDLEVVAVDISGYLYAFHHDGSEVLDGDDNPATDGVFEAGLGAWNLCSPALCDLDGEPGAEIIITDGDGVLHAFKSDGSEAPGFPLLPEGGGCMTKAPILVADLDGNGSSEIIVLGEWEKLFVFTADGENFGDFPIAFESAHPYDPGPGPAACNLDGDANLELLVVENITYTYLCKLHLMDHEGNDLPGWPIELATSAYASPLIGDVDGDGQLEFIVGCENGLIYGFNEDGSVQSGFPISVGGEVRGAPALVDLDQDGDVELVSATFNKQLFVWDFEGEWSEESFPWPTHSGNYRRTGCYGDWDDVPVLLEGLSLSTQDRSVLLEWQSESPELRSWSLERERRLDTGFWGESTWVFQDMSFAGGIVYWEDENLRPGTQYRYFALAHLSDGGEEQFHLGEVELPPAVWKDKLHGAFPNPFNPTTTLLFEMAVEGPARLEIFSVEGRRVLTLVDERLAVGQHERDWDGRDENGRALASGIYLARFTRPGMSEAKRLVLLK